MKMFKIRTNLPRLQKDGKKKEAQVSENGKIQVP